MPRPLLLLFALTLAAPVAAQAPPEKGAVRSRLKITLPDPVAELKIEGRATRASGAVREFETPPVEKGEKYVYEFEASWKPNNYTAMTRRKSVQFKGGDDLTIDLTRADEGDKVFIRFVPTPEDIVAQMVKLAGVKAGDVVYEPGCGDGRVLIAAVRAGADKATGIDLDPERVAESKDAVAAAKLDKKITIKEGDALEFKGLSDVSVVFLYMGDEFNVRFRPLLWKHLKVGARVVSHRFEMGDWKPDQTLPVRGEDGEEYILHLWTVTDEVKKKAK